MQDIKPKPMFQYRITDGFLLSLATNFKTPLKKDQGDCIRLICKYADDYQITDVRMVAYMLATAYHECRFQAIKEIRAQPGTKIYDLQNRYWNTGFYGRGYVQLTWEKNYQKFSDLLNQDFVGNPDLVLVPENAAKILVHGMVNGSFTGKKLSDYFKEGNLPDWLGARRIVNGTDQAERIAQQAQKMHALLVVDGI